MQDEHLECVSDFNGNSWAGKPGAWADLWKRPNGSRYISLGGGWDFYAPGTPETIDETSPHFGPFLESCLTGEDFGFCKKTFSTAP